LKVELPKEIEIALMDYLSGNIDPELQVLLDAWIESSPDNKQWFDELLASRSQMNDLELLYELKHPKHWEQMHQKMRHSRQHIFIRKISKVAAIFIGFMVIALGVYYVSRPSQIIPINQKMAIEKIQPGGAKAILSLDDGSVITLDNAQNGVLAKQGNTKITKLVNGQLVYSTTLKLPHADIISYNTLSIPRGGEYQLTLPDGTKVWLNSDTKLRYPTLFSGNTREVSLLKGEAYFEVAKNPKCPFILKVNNKADIKVLGTHFNVMAYEDEPEMETTLVEGSVNVNSSNGTTINLTPGQQSRLKSDGSLSKMEVNTFAYTAWKDGIFFFNNEDMGSIMRKLNRWYNVNIEFETDGAKNVVFFGKLKRYETIDKILEMIRLTHKVDYTLKENTIWIRKI
jgi:transmembrane sensor